MTPYSSPTPGTAAESYNKALSRAHVTIQNTFGRLKNRWRCVCKDRMLHYKPEKCAQIILACSVLHNIALDFAVPDPQEPIIGNKGFIAIVGFNARLAGFIVVANWYFLLFYRYSRIPRE